MIERDRVRGSDSQLIQIVDAALLAATVRSGPWLVCKPGCSQCCVGVFSINQLDVARLKGGLSQLRPEDRERVQRRAAESVARLSADFPGDPATGLLGNDAESEERFSSFADDEPCPALDPATGTCDLYAWRPMTCRVFGPPVRSKDGVGDGLGVCELCYRDASPEEIAACEMAPDPDDVESDLVADLERRNGVRGNTLVAFALAQ